MKNNNGKIIGGVLIAIALVLIVGIAGIVTGYLNLNMGNNTAQQVNQQLGQDSIIYVNTGQNTGVVYSQQSNPLPVENLYANGKNKFTQATINDANVSFYVVGADVADPNVKPMESIITGSNSTGSVIQTETAYDIWLNGNSSNYYDEKITSAKINMNPETGTGYVVSGDLSYIPVSPVGAFVSLNGLPETSTCMYDTFYNSTNLINGSGDLTARVGNDTMGNVSSALMYVKTDVPANATSFEPAFVGCANTGWFQIDIGNANANAELIEPVMCFRDNNSEMEGDELTALTASFVSGSTRIKVPNSLLTLWKDAMGGGGASCVAVADIVGSGEKARWELSITVDEANWEGLTTLSGRTNYTGWYNNESFQITFDDMGGYLDKQYPSRNAKATAVSLEVVALGS